MLGPWLAWLAERLDNRFHWDRLPPKLGLLTLIGLRYRLRERNLYDAGVPAGETQDLGDGSSPRWLERTLDGSHTHPQHVNIGAAGTRFGRNAPPLPEHDLHGSLPPPQVVSDALLRRREFQPAPSLNLLAAAWLQFEVHDWFSHQVEPDTTGPLGLAPLRRDPTSKGSLPMFLSEQTHWWDASQLYGANETFARSVRSEDSETTGKVKVGDELLAAMTRSAAGSAGAEAERAAGPRKPVPNLWLGLGIFHDVFAREHNAICDCLHAAYPRWSGDRLYAKARLVNAAVMAKIHTVEWTPALLAHPTTADAIRRTWWGLLGEGFTRRFGRVGRGEMLSGIPGSRLDDEFPYAITEEFVAVYRLHPLIPDELTFHRASDGQRMDDLEDGATVSFERLAASFDDPDVPRERLRTVGLENAWYSLGIAHPGMPTLHNHPQFKPRLPSGEPLDLGAADILRTRECGVPRYNEFRRSLRMPPATSFRALADGNTTFARELERVYGHVEEVDLIVGLMVDRKPEGFAISETAFRVFLLMAARRLRSDPFFTTHYRPSVYSHVGLRWIEEATMTAMLRRHYRRLEPALRGVDNPFQPWPVLAG